MAIDKSKMKCNKPRRQVQGGKKFVVKACKGGKERARHKCATATDKFTARYWSCKKW